MVIKIETKKGRDLSKSFIRIFDEAKQKEFKSGPIKNFSKYHKDLFFIIKSNKKVLSFGQLKKIKINYLGAKYNIFGIANIISLEKKKGYGKKIVLSMSNYSKKRGKTLIGFCQKHNEKFYEKCGIKLDKSLLKRFFYKKTMNKYEDYVIYLEGKDKFIQKILPTKSKIILDVPFW